jgi:predicted acetyltransferase
MYSYLCDDGFTSYQWHDASKALFVQRVQGTSAETVRELWSVIASHATVAETIHAWTGPADPLWWLTRERDTDITHRSMWMLRVVDAPAAIAARGFPPAVSLAVPLIINDQSRPANSGQWMLSVAGGKGELVPAASGTAAVTLGARGLAALFAGTPMATLRLAGLAAAGDGNAGTDAALDAAFAANAYLLDGF